MKKIILSILSLFLILSNSFAQYQAFNWIAGPKSLLYFHKGSNLSEPVPFISSSSVSSSAYSIMSDSSGQIIIYVKNDTVFFPTTSSGEINPVSFYSYAPYQPFIIRANEKNNGKIEFEIFSLATISNKSYSLYYSSGTINGSTLTLDNTNKEIANGLSSKMAVYYTSHSIVVTHENNSSNYVIFSDLPNSTKQTFNLGSQYDIGGNFDNGFFKFSPSGKYLACTSPDNKELDVFSFDTINAELSNKLSLTDKAYNAIEFAAGNDTILYASIGNDIYQININANKLTKSDEPIGSSSQTITNMQLAPDGKIYVAKSNDSFLGAIFNPEIQDSACFYVDQQIPLQSTSNGIIPAFPANYFKNIPIITWQTNKILFDTPVNFNINYPITPDSSFWDFDNGHYIPFYSNTVTQSIKKLGETTIKIVLFFNSNSKNSWDSVVLTKKIIITKPADMHLISPYDTIICDTNNSFNVHINYPNPNRKFIWTSKSGKYNETNTNTDPTFKYPDVYYLEIQDTLSNTLAYDSLVVKQYTPYIDKPETSSFPFLLNGTNLAFEVLVKQQPEDFLDINNLDFEWNFGNGNTNTGKGLHITDQTYNTEGNYTISVKVSGIGACSYNLTKNIKIIDTIMPNIPFLNIHNAEICDTNKNQVEIKIPVTNYPFKIKWFYYNHELTSNNNKHDLYTSKPGKYYVRLYDTLGTFFYIDSVMIHYFLCQDIDTIKISANGKKDNISVCDGNSEVNFVVNIQSSSSCTVDQANFFYSWDFGDGATATDYNLSDITHKYTKAGQYLARVFVYDEKGCEHVAKRIIKIQEQTPDTIYLRAKEKDAQGNYIFDFKTNNILKQNFIDKSTFRATTSTHSFASSASTFSLNIKSLPNISIKNTDDITVFIKFALWGNFNASIISPAGKTADISTSNYSNVLLFGYPAFNYNDVSLSKTKTFFFNTKGEPVNDKGTGFVSNSFYSPTDTMFEGNFYFVPNTLLKLNNAKNLLGQNINGTWKLLLSSAANYGKIISWGIIFNPSLFTTSILPDYIFCSDQDGNVYNTTNLVLRVPDIGGGNNILNCEIHYANTDCTIKKILKIDFPKTADVLTPNGDGINDFWMPVSTNSEANIVVIDKIGRVVANFKAADMPHGWDGTYKNKPLPSDSYWYIIKLKNGKILKGVLTIIR